MITEKLLTIKANIENALGNTQNINITYIGNILNFSWINGAKTDAVRRAFEYFAKKENFLIPRDVTLTREIIF